MTSDKYDLNVQKMLISLMVLEPSYFVRVQGILKDAFFHPSLRRSVRFIQEYVLENTQVPPAAVVKAHTGFEVDPIPTEDIPRCEEGFFSTIEGFCRYRALESAVMNGVDMVTEGKYGELEASIKEALLITLNRDLGTDYFLDPRARLLKMKAVTQIPTGWDTIDRILYGGFGLGTLNIFCAGSGGGKSLMLQNLAINQFTRGKNVAYITLELAEELCSMRIDSMLTGVSTKEIFRDLDNVELAVKMQAKKSGRFFIKKMPEGGTTVNDIKAYLKELYIQTGTKIDFLCVDYLDLMIPARKGISVSELFIKDKYVSEELRALANEFQLILATAAQLGRSSVEETNYNHSHIAGGISKINTADNVIALLTTAPLREQGLYEVQFLKTRSSAGVGMKTYLSFDQNTLRIFDRPEAEDTIPLLAAGGPITRLSQLTAPSTSTTIAAKPATSVSDILARVNAVRGNR